MPVKNSLLAHAFQQSIVSRKFVREPLPDDRQCCTRVRSVDSGLQSAQYRKFAESAVSEGSRALRRYACPEGHMSAPQSTGEELEGTLLHPLARKR